MPFAVALFTYDQELATFCREVLAEVFGPESALVTRAGGRVESGDDVCVWDFVPGESLIPRDLSPVDPAKHFFLVHRDHLAALQAHLGAADLNVLLKPVTRATLRAFLDGVARRREERPNPDRIATLRVERDEMLQVLILANLKLQEYDQQRNRFLARSLHDFRSPLTAIGGYCGLLLEEDAGPLSAEQAQILQRMQHNVRRLSRLSESMFQLSIPRDVEQSPKLERANIRDSIDEALGDVTLFLEDKRILVSVDVESSEDLLFEPSQIQQAICNLLDNACKFTPRDGTIDIRGYPFFWERRSAEVAIIERSIDRRSRQTKAPNSFRVDIRDSGPGIPEAVVETIFEEFSSYSGGQDRSGWGLGLAISRMILHRHRGRIWAESHPDGAVFSFVLPFQPDASNPAGWAGESEGAHFAKSVEN